MPQTIKLPLHFIRLRFHSGGDFLSPVGDQQALHLFDALAPLRERYLHALHTNIRESSSPEILLREILPGPFKKDTLTLEFPEAADGMQHPAFEINLTWYYNEGPNQYRGLIPALGIETVAPNPEKLHQHLLEVAQSALSRKQAGSILEKAITTIWFTETELLKSQGQLEVYQPWEIGATGDTSAKGWLQKVAVPVLTSPAPIAFGRESELNKLALAMRNPYQKSCVLAGPSGIGKSALIYEWIRQYGHEQAVWETTAARLIKELSADGGWQDAVMFLIREMQQSGAVLYVRQLRELFEVGQYEGNNISLAEYLAPVLQRGELALLSECTPADRVWIERKSPGFFNAIQTIYLHPQPEKLPDIIFRKISRQAKLQEVKVTRPAVAEAIDLHRRFFPYAGEPGQTIRFLQQLIRRELTPGMTLKRQQVIAHFSAQSGIPQSMIDLQTVLPRAELHRYFASRLFGQTPAVDDITDMLAAVRNQLMRTDKPIASFLFVGPTGVGKTELAKILAEYMFGARTRMQRFDMSEFSSAAAVYRLTAPGKGLLTSAIRQNPFCVLLFDELEKAHPDFFDLLLQILGEGRLTDQGGQLVSFCSTIIIMTSNIGATAAGKSAISLRQKEEITQWRDHYLRAVEKQLRPELINRIDRITPFDPLRPEDIRQVVDRELSNLRKREGIRFRKLDLEIADEVREYLARKGYDPKLGARQLQRTLRDELLLPLARQLNVAPTDEHLLVKLELAPEDGIQVQVTTDPLNVELWLEEYEKIRVSEHISSLRRDLQQARQSALYVDFLSEIEVLQRHRQEDNENFWRHATWPNRYKILTSRKDDFDRKRNEIDEMEEEMSLVNFGLRPYQTAIGNQVDEWENEFLRLRWQIYLDLKIGNSPLFLMVYGKDPRRMIDLYQGIFDGMELHATEQFVLLHEPEKGEAGLQIAAFDPKELTDDDWDQVYGWIAEVEGFGKESLEFEHGLTEWTDAKGNASYYLVQTAKEMENTPNARILRRDFYEGIPRRIIRNNHLKDRNFDLSEYFGKDGCAALIASGLRKSMEFQVEKVWI